MCWVISSSIICFTVPVIVLKVKLVSVTIIFTRKFAQLHPPVFLFITLFLHAQLTRWPHFSRSSHHIHIRRDKFRTLNFLILLILGFYYDTNKSLKMRFYSVLSRHLRCLSLEIDNTSVWMKHTNENLARCRKWQRVRTTIANSLV